MNLRSHNEPVAALHELVQVMVTGFRAGAKAVAAHGLVVDDAKITSMIKEQFEESVREDARLIDVDSPDPTPTMAGAFRMVFNRFGIDPADQIEQERWFTVLERAIEQALAR